MPLVEFTKKLTEAKTKTFSRFAFKYYGLSFGISKKIKKVCLFTL